VLDIYTYYLQIWTEATDPDKFIHEDLAIASYLYSFWKKNGNMDASIPLKFVDFGCGNGVLTFILSQLGMQGYGFDIRHRKIWQHLKVVYNTDLRVRF